MLRWKRKRQFWAASADDPARLAFYGNFIAAGDVVFDVGANRGSRSRIFHLLGARVVAFEPQPHLAAVLRHTFSGKRAATVVEAALGASASISKMVLSNADVLSTLSTEWIETMRRSGRFVGVETWEDNDEILVVVGTLDNAIAEFDEPRFTKIDVEGYELQVLEGLSRPLRGLSIEFATEGLDTTKRCVARLASLSDYRFQVSLGESLRFELATWLTADEMTSYIDTTLRSREGGWGDLYARRSADLSRIGP